MSTGKNLRRTALIVAAVVLVAGVGGVVLTKLSGNSTTVTGVFADANPIIAGDTVRASGVEVGKVTAVSLEQGRAHVSMSLDRSVLPLHRDATLKIRPVNLLGEQYVELNVGTPSAPLLAQPATIPEGQTSRAVELQDVLNSLNDPTSAALATLVTGLGEGMQGEGPDLAASITALRPALSDVDRLGQILKDQNQVLTQLLDHAQPVAGALATDKGASLDRLVDSTDHVLTTVSANKQALDQTLITLPDTLVKAQRTLGELTAVSQTATPTLASLRPITDNLRQVSGEITQLTNAANPALSSLGPVLDHAQALLDQAAPLVQQLGPAGQKLRGVAASAQPTAETLIRNLGNVMDFVRWWALSTNGYDGLSHYFRGVAVETPGTLLTAAHGAGVPPNPPKPPTLPGVPGLPGLPLPGLPLPPLVNPGPPSDSSNATGLTPQQEQSMLGQLLGGP